jgi:hypothetical protein
MNNRALNAPLVIFIVVFITMTASLITYQYQEYARLQRSTTFEVVEITAAHIILKNNGTNIATNLTAKPETTFDPPTIAPGETSRGKFKKRIYGYKLITIRSIEGNKFEVEYGKQDEQGETQDLGLC